MKRIRIEFKIYPMSITKLVIIKTELPCWVNKLKDWMLFCEQKYKRIPPSPQSFKEYNYNMTIWDEDLLRTNSDSNKLHKKMTNWEENFKNSYKYLEEYQNMNLGSHL